MPTYFSLVTLAGQQKIAESIGGGAAIDISHLAVGDGNGLPTTPTEGATALVHEVWRGSVTNAARDPGNPTQVIVTATIPLAVGPFTIREAAILTSDGEVFAIANYPQTYKPAPVEGTAAEIVVEFVVVVDSAASMTVMLSPTAMVATNLLLRQPFIAVDSMTVTAPPGDPDPGDLYVIPPAATGVWAGRTHDFAQWSGTEWVFAEPPLRTVIGLIDQGIYMRRTADGWVPFHATETERGIIRLATIADLAARDAFSAVTPALLSRFGLDMPIFPEVSAPSRLMTATVSVGQVVLNAAQKWVWRGLHAFSTDNFSAPARTFATVASKTYHLRWYAPGHTLAPVATYPFGRLMLRDLADVAYNPTALAETDAGFDTGYDDMLIGRVVTSAGNAPTFTALANAAVLVGEIAGASRSITWPSGAETSHVYDFTLAWARTPRLALKSMQPPGNAYDSDYTISPSIVRREAVQVYSWSWHHQHSGEAVNMQSPGFSYDLRA